MIGFKISELRAKSLIIGGSEICEIIVLYAEMSNGTWYSISIIDGYSEILSVKAPQLLGKESINDEYRYPIKKYSSSYIQGMDEIVSVDECLKNGNSDACVGLILESKNQQKLVLVENEGCLSLFSNIEVLTKYNNLEIRPVFR